MMPFLCALALAWCFASLGEVITGRRSNAPLEWNQAFLVGLSAVSLAFVPLSAFIDSYALPVTLAGVVLAGVWGVFQKRSLPRRPVLRFDPWSAGFLFLTAALFVQFWLQNSRLTFMWDGYQIWGTKALMYFHEGALGKRWVSLDYEARLTAYPHMVSLYEALLAKLLGGFVWNSLKPVFIFFYLSLLLATYHAARLLMPQRVAYAVTLFTAMLPALSTRQNVGGLADMPQAVFVAAALAALLECKPGWRSPAPWLTGGLIFVKSEGLILALLCAAVVLAMVRSSISIRRYWQPVAVFATFVVVRLVSLRWIASQDTTFGPIDQAHFHRALDNLWLVPKACAREMFSFEEWGAFWPVFCIAATVILFSGAPLERALTGWILAVLAAYMSIFYFTNWDMAVHINQSFTRLLSQVAPAAAIVIGAAFVRMRGRGT